MRAAEALVRGLESTLMKTSSGIILTVVSFVAIWILASAAILLFGDEAWADSAVDAWLKTGTARFLCPRLGACYAPKATAHQIEAADI